LSTGEKKKKGENSPRRSINECPVPSLPYGVEGGKEEGDRSLFDSRASAAAKKKRKKHRWPRGKGGGNDSYPSSRRKLVGEGGEGVPAPPYTSARRRREGEGFRRTLLLTPFPLELPAEGEEEEIMNSPGRKGGEKNTGEAFILHDGRMRGEGGFS